MLDKENCSISAFVASPLSRDMSSVSFNFSVDFMWPLAPLTAPFFFFSGDFPFALFLSSLESFLSSSLSISPQLNEALETEIALTLAFFSLFETASRSSSSLLMNLLILLMLTLAWTAEVIIMGNMLRGNLRMLNKAREVKAFWASRTLFSSERTYTAKVTRDTRKGAQVQMKLMAAER